MVVSAEAHGVCLGKAQPKRVEWLPGHSTGLHRFNQQHSDAGQRHGRIGVSSDSCVVQKISEVVAFHIMSQEYMNAQVRRIQRLTHRPNS